MYAHVCMYCICMCVMYVCMYVYEHTYKKMLRRKDEVETEQPSQCKKSRGTSFVCSIT